MGIFDITERRKITRENCRSLRPYILWKRRKENALEASLILQVKEEEEKKQKDKEEIKRQEEEKQVEKMQKLKEELKNIEAKRHVSEEKLKQLQEEKHNLFLKLKNTLMAKETERREKYFKDREELYGNFTEYGHLAAKSSQYIHGTYFPEQQQAFSNIGSQNQSTGYGYTEHYHAPMHDQQWQWSYGQTSQQSIQNDIMRPSNV